LAGAVAALPKFDRDTMDRIFNANLQDLLMVVYLANLTRTQLSLAEKLQRVV
jgi:translation initiation factor 3 subunit F